MNFEGIDTKWIKTHLNPLQKMVIQYVRDFPHTGNYDADIKEMKDYIYEYEQELDKRGIEYTGIDSKLKEINV